MKTNADFLQKKLKDKEAFLISGKANIYYYSGFTSEDAALYISKEHKAIITDSRYTVQAAEQAKDFEAYIGTVTNFLENADEETIYFEEKYLSAAEYIALKNHFSGKKTFSGEQSDISEPRKVKSDEEIKKIAAAEALGDKAFEHILSFIKPGAREVDLALEMEFFMRKNGAQSLSFETICASGIRGSMPHGTASDKKIESGDFVTLDFGCVLDGYCSDMTRTVAVGSADKRLSEIYNTVLKAQKAAIEKIKAGEACSSMDAIARDIIKEAGFGEYFGHSLGHSVGLEIHENPNLSPRSKDTLKAGNVVTVEPGIYIPSLGGVRIEDVVAVTENGCINLTHSPKELIIL